MARSPISTAPVRRRAALASTTVVRRAGVGSALLAAALAGAAPARAGERVLWRIGAVDASSGEFAGPFGIDHADPAKDPVFTVGKSRAATDWQGFQPGPANGAAGGRLHPFTILFRLAGPPRGLYRLTVATLYETQRRSILGVEVNGKRGRYHLEPTLDYAAGDWQGTFVPQTSTATRVIELPARLLRAGDNRIVLTALDEPATPEQVMGAITTGHTGLVYDALALSQDAAAEAGPAQGALRAAPTIFYRAGRAGGGETELVEVTADLSPLPRAGQVTLTLGGHRLRRAFQTSDDFGEVRVELDVPAWEGLARGEIVLEAAGQVRRLPVALTAARRWTVKVVPHEHLDIGFTDYPAKVAEMHAQSLDDAMALMARHPDFRWTPDGFWVIAQYLTGRAPARVAALLARLRDGRMALPAAYANQHTGTASLEGLLRSLYGSRRFAREHGLVPPDTAHITDVPSYSWSYASVLAASGLRYLVAGSNGWRAPAVLLARWNERSPFYWEGPDGGRVLLWYSRAYLQLHTLAGSPHSLDALRDSLPVFLQAYSRPDYRARTVLLFGSQLENTPMVREQAELSRQWAARFRWPRLEPATFSEAMHAIERDWQGPIPIVRGDLGPYWEDGFGSDAAATAAHRDNQARVATAEKLSTLPALLDAGLRPERGRLERAWDDLLRFDEHTWSFVLATAQPEAEQTVVQTELKRAQPAQARRELAETIQRAWQQLAGLLALKEGSVVVFNPLSWRRSDPVEVDLPDGFELHDAAGRRVPFEVRTAHPGGALPGFGGGFRRIRFLAADLPALGYRRYPFALGRPVGDQVERPPGGGPLVFESPYYRIRLAPGAAALASVVDKALGRELVDPHAPYPFGALVYVTGGDDAPRNGLYRFGAGLAPPTLTPHVAAGGRLVAVRETPFGTVLTMEASAPHTPRLRVELTLRSDQRRIDLRYDLTKERVRSKEGVYVAFPFAVAAPRFGYDTQNGWVDPARDELPGGSREWYAVQHWAAVRGEGIAAAILPVDAPLVAFGDLVRGRWPRDFAPASSAVFSWVMNNYWGTNFVPWQGGDFTFRYALTSSRELDPAALTRAGLEARTPPEVGQLGAAPGPARLPPDEASLLELEGGDVALVTWKLAEDGRGSVARLLELGGRPARVRLSSRLVRFGGAWRCSALEDDRAALPLSAGAVTLELGPYELATVRLISRP